MKKFHHCIVCLLTLFIFLSVYTTAAVAIEISFHGASSIKNKFLIGASTLGIEDGLAAIRPIPVSGSIAGIGRFKGYFTQAQVFSETLVSFRGTVTTKGKTFPWSASYFKNINTLSIFFTDTSRSNDGKRAFGLEVRVPVVPEEDLNQAQVLRSPLNTLRGSCGSTSLDTLEEDPATPEEVDTSGDEEAKKIKTHILGQHSKKISKHVIQLSVVLDPGAISAIGSLGYSPSDYVNSVVNAANTILASQMKYSINVSQLSLLSQDPFTTSVSNDLLDSFAHYRVNNKLYGDYDLYHMFTNRDLDSNIIGIAYTGALCNNAFLRFSITQMIPLSLQHLVFIHELGHNMGAHHDESGANTIMAPGLKFTDPPKNFSKKSLSQMKNYLTDGHSSCTKKDSLNALPSVIGERSGTINASSKYDASFYLSTNEGESTLPYPLSIQGRVAALGAKFSDLYSSKNSVYGLNFASQTQAQYRASITDGTRMSVSSILTIPDPDVHLTLHKSGNSLSGALKGISYVFPATIEIVDRSTKRSAKTLATVKTDSEGNFSTPLPSKGTKFIARWYYVGSKEAVYSKVAK